MPENPPKVIRYFPKSGYPLKHFIRDGILDTLWNARGDVKTAAEMLKVSERKLRYLMRKHEIDLKRFRARGTMLRWKK